MLVACLCVCDHENEGFDVFETTRRLAALVLEDSSVQLLPAGLSTLSSLTRLHFQGHNHPVPNSPLLMHTTSSLSPVPLSTGLTSTVASFDVSFISVVARLP